MYVKSLITRKFNSSILIYLAAFFLLYPDINFGANNFFSNKPLSIWICFVYILLNISKVAKKIRIEELMFFCGLVGSLLLGFALGGGNNGIARTINGYVGFFSIYLAVKIFAMSATKNQIFRLLRTMYKSYVFVILFFGGLQIIYIYLGYSDAIGQLLKLLLYRGSDYFYGSGISGKLSFAFSEPSLAGSYFYLYFIPVYLLCKKYNLVSERKSTFVLGLMFMMNMLTISTRWLIDTFVCILILIISSKKSGKISKSTFIKIITSVVAAIVLMVIAINYIIPKEIVNNLINRIMIVITSTGTSSFDADQSSTVRMILIVTGLIGFIHNPILGYGTGNFYVALKEHIIWPNSRLAYEELMVIANTKESTSYSFYVTSLCEGGVFGIMMITSVLRTLFKSRVKEFKILRWFAIYMFLQLELFGTVVLALWLAIINSGCFISKDTERTI